MVRDPPGLELPPVSFSAQLVGFAGDQLNYDESAPHFRWTGHVGLRFHQEPQAPGAGADGEGWNWLRWSRGWDWCPDIIWGLVSHHLQISLEFISPIVGWCLIGTFSNPCEVKLAKIWRWLRFEPFFFWTVLWWFSILFCIAMLSYQRVPSLLAIIQAYGWAIRGILGVVDSWRFRLQTAVVGSLPSLLFVGGISPSR